MKLKIFFLEKIFQNFFKYYYFFLQNKHKARKGIDFFVDFLQKNVKNSRKSKEGKHQ